MANVFTNTLTRLENGEELRRRTLEEAGVEFTNGDQPGVRMKRSP
jgi:hypothetical protein